MRIRLFLPLILFCMLALSGGSAPAFALDITNFRLGAHPDKTRVVVEMDSPSPSFRAFILADPVRLVIDLPDFRWRVGSIAKPPGTGVTDIRQGPLQPGISRIVVDLEREALIQSAFFLPRGNGQPDRLVVDFKKAAPNAFQQNRSKTYGALRVDGSGPGLAAAPPPKPSPAAVTPPVTAPKAILPVAQRPLIVLDPGHGGQDPGALGAGQLMEKNITLAMARDLKRHLEATGRYRVILTRDKDVFIRLSQRVAFARSKGADLFISLHADSINRPGVSGASIYTLSEKASDAETEKLAARENHADLIAGMDLNVEDKDVANILVDLAMRDTMNQSKFFANKTVTHLRARGVKTLENPHRFAGFAVLKAPDIPSVLIELGYMSNAKESAMLSRPEYRDQIARGLVLSIDDYFETIRQ